MSTSSIPEGGGGYGGSCGFSGGSLHIQLSIGGYHRHYYIAAAYAYVYWPGRSSTSIWSFMRTFGWASEVPEGTWTAQYHHRNVPTGVLWHRLDGYGAAGTPVGTWRHWSGADVNYDWYFEIEGKCGIVFDF